MQLIQSAAFTSSIALGLALICSFAPSEVSACAPKVNGSVIPTDLSGIGSFALPKGKHEVVLGTTQDFDQDATSSALQLIQYKIDAYAVQTNQKLPDHEETVIEGHGKILIRSLVDASSVQCNAVKKFFRNLKPSFPNITFISIRCEDGRTDIII